MGGHKLFAICARIADSQRFQIAVFVVIVLNAITLGLLTYEGIERDYGELLDVLDNVFIGIFVVEILIRLLAFGSRPQDFFKDGWNVFDFIVVGAAFLPGLRENATLLRLVRLARVVRIVSVLPDLRVLIRGMVKSLPPIGSMAVMALMLIYVYGMVGWLLFHEDDPEHWNTIGDAMLNMFVILTLESWPDIMGRAQEIHPASWMFFVSYVLLASFLLINILIAIIISSMEEARIAEHEAEVSDLTEKAAHGHGAIEGLDPAVRAETVERLIALRAALEELELQLGVPGATGSGEGGKRSPTGMAGRMASKARMRP